MKKEAYAEVKDPRNITPLSSQLRLLLCQYAYPFQDAVKAWPFYGFKRPREQAQRVVDICRGAMYAVPTDFSRFDGKLNRRTRQVEEIVLRRAFQIGDGDLEAAINRRHHVEACTTEGVKYNSADSRLSGSPFTSVMNTVVNAYVCYRAYRMQTDVATGEYLSPTQAFAMLGVYGGDDGISTDIDPDALVRAAEMYGLTIKAQRINRGDLGIEFLSRLYSRDVWTGCLDSCCDIRRQLSKIHVTVGLGGTKPEVRFLEKMQSFLCTDSNTPVIGAIVRRTMTLAGLELDPDLVPDSVRSFNSVGASKEHLYPNENDGNWMDEILARQLPGFQRELLDEHLSSSTTLAALTQFPLCMEVSRADPPDVVVVDDDLVGPATETAKKGRRRGKRGGVVSRPKGSAH
jgi:hypothetical protein